MVTGDVFCGGAAPGVGVPVAVVVLELREEGHDEEGDGAGLVAQGLKARRSTAPVIARRRRARALELRIDDGRGVLVHGEPPKHVREVRFDER